MSLEGMILILFLIVIASFGAGYCIGYCNSDDDTQKLLRR